MIIKDPNKHGGWIGVDLDGTLALYDGWKGPDHIGAPIPKMVAFVRDLIEKGWTVKIFTARVGPQKQPQDRVHAAQAIRVWTKRHLGVELVATHEKDFSMAWMFDDRCTQVLPNTGIRLEPPELEDDEPSAIDPGI